jgi:hypothetical protein
MILLSYTLKHRFCFISQLCFVWFEFVFRLLNFVTKYAIATLAPRLEWPRHRHIAPPRSSKLLVTNFLDGLLEITRIWDSWVAWSWIIVGWAEDTSLVLDSKQAGTYTPNCLLVLREVPLSYIWQLSTDSNSSAYQPQLLLRMTDTHKMVKIKSMDCLQKTHGRETRKSNHSKMSTW